MTTPTDATVRLKPGDSAVAPEEAKQRLEKAWDRAILYRQPHNSIALYLLKVPPESAWETKATLLATLRERYQVHWDAGMLQVTDINATPLMKVRNLPQETFIALPAYLVCSEKSLQVLERPKTVAAIQAAVPKIDNSTGIKP